MVENIIANIAKNTTDEDLKDLANDIYLDLLEKNEELLAGIYERGQMNYYITRIVINSINSKTSRFYYLYKKNNAIQSSIDDTIEKGERADYDTD